MAKTCTFPGCSVKFKAKGLCHRHYENWRKQSKTLKRTAKEIVEAAKAGKQACPLCGAVKPLEDFPVDVRSTLGRGASCNDCLRLRHFTPDKTWPRNLKRYGITPADYEDLLTLQGGVCAICQREEIMIEPRTGQPRRLAVDHCHTKQVVRGLLCVKCNQGLGSFKDSPGLLQSAIAYLSKKKE